MTRGRKARVEGADSPAREQADHRQLAELVAYFKDTHPVVWERIRLGPTQHGLEQMIATLSD